MKANQSRGAVIFTSIVAGMIIGLFAGAYLYTAWIPASMILKNASPKYLNNDPVHMTPQYRDFYIVRAAEVYARDLQSGTTDPLKAAFDVLGVTTGDTSIDEAISMVQSAQKVAAKENSVDGDAGQFTKNDELALASLEAALVNAKQTRGYPIIDLSKYAPAIERTTVRVAGLVILLLLALLAFGAIYLVDRWTQGRTTPALATPTNLAHTARVPVNTGLRDSIPPDLTPSVIPDVATTQPGFTPATPAVAPAVAPVAPSETPLATFAPTVYRHGDDHFDEDFAINGSMGELIGECGASIADRIGVESPARVSALSLWVFDKNDFQSTTKMLLTEYAWNDPVIRTKLKARGDAVLAINGGVVEILTSMLRVDVTVNGLELNSDNNPPQGYFDNVTLTFTVYRREVQNQPGA